MANIEGSISLGGKLQKGILQKTGLDWVFVASERKLKSLTNIDSKIYYEKHTGSYILTPNINTSLKDMALTDADFIYPTNWELVTSPSFSHKLLYHKKTDEEDVVSFKTVFQINQGGIFWWEKWVSSDSSKPLTFYFLGTSLENDGQLFIRMFPSKNVDVIYQGKILYHGSLPKNEINTNSPFASFNFLIVLIVKDQIIIGLNGLENSIGLKINNPVDTTTDKKGREYPIILRNHSAGVAFHGCIMLGFNQLYFEQNGELNSNNIMPGYTIEPEYRINNLIEFVNTDINLQKKEDSGSAASYKFKYKIEMAGSDYGTAKAGYCGLSPILFSYEIKENPTRISAVESPWDLDTDIEQYNETQSQGKDGIFTGASSTTLINCYSNQHSSILSMRNAKMIFTFEGNTRSTHLSDKIHLRRPSFGKWSIEINGIDIIKRLKNSTLLDSLNYDGKNHGEMIKDLCDYSGCPYDLTKWGNYSSSSVFPKAADEKSSNFQFKKGVDVWSCMQQIVKYSGWILYPDNEGEMIYKERPDKSASTKYIFYTNPDIDANQIGILDLEGEFVDIVRTRILVVGKASKESSGKYKAEETFHVRAPKDIPEDGTDLEKEIGETRVGIYLDSSIGNEIVAGEIAKNIFNWYIKPHRFINFKIPDATGCLDLFTFDKIKLVDNEGSLSGEYQVSSLDLTITPYEAYCNLEAMYLT